MHEQFEAACARSAQSPRRLQEVLASFPQPELPRRAEQRNAYERISYLAGALPYIEQPALYNLIVPYHLNGGRPWTTGDVGPTTGRMLAIQVECSYVSLSVRRSATQPRRRAANQLRLQPRRRLPELRRLGVARMFSNGERGVGPSRLARRFVEHRDARRVRDRSSERYLGAGHDP